VLVYPMLDDRTVLRDDHAGRGRWLWAPGADGLAPKAASMQRFTESMLDHLRTYLQPRRDASRMFSHRERALTAKIWPDFRHGRTFGAIG